MGTEMERELEVLVVLVVFASTFLLSGYLIDGRPFSWEYSEEEAE